MKYRKHFEKNLKVAVDKNFIELQNVFCNDEFVSKELKMSTLNSISVITEYFKFLSIFPTSHTAWLFDFGNEKIVISPEARKEFGDLKGVSPFKTYEFGYFAYCLNDFAKIKKNFKTHKLQIPKKTLEKLFYQVLADASKKNAKNEKYSLLHNNCAINMLKSVKAILGKKLSIFDLPYFYLTQFLPKRISALLSKL